MVNPKGYAAAAFEQRGGESLPPPVRNRRPAGQTVGRWVIRIKDGGDCYIESLDGAFEVDLRKPEGFLLFVDAVVDILNVGHGMRTR